MVVVAGAGEGQAEPCPVMSEWLKLEALVTRASQGKIALYHSKEVSRTTLEDNHELLIPLISNYGILIQFLKMSLVPLLCNILYVNSSYHIPT